MLCADCSAPNACLQSAFFNPGILMAVTVRGGMPAGDFFALLAAEIVGYFAGGRLLCGLHSGALCWRGWVAWVG